MFFPISISSIFGSSETRETKAKLNKWDYIAQCGKPLRKQRQPTEWGIYLQMILCSIPKI